MKNYQKVISNGDFEEKVIPEVVKELERIHARELMSCKNGKHKSGARRRQRRDICGDPPSNLSPLAYQVWLIKQSEQLGYAAGVVDGEGCVSAVRQIYPDRKHPSVRIRVDITQNDYAMLEYVQDILDCGGHLNPVKRQSVQNRQCYQLSWDGWHAVEVLMKLRRLLRRKKAEADACLRLWVDGELSRCSGRKGLDQTTVDIREYWIRRIQKMK